MGYQTAMDLLEAGQTDEERERHTSLKYPERQVALKNFNPEKLAVAFKKAGSINP